MRGDWSIQVAWEEGMSRLITMVLVAALLGSPAGASAQSILLGGSGGFGTFRGDHFEHIEAGYTIGGHLLFETSSHLYLGGAFDFSSYGLEDTAEDVGQIDILGVFRYLFAAEGTRLFAGTRIGFTRQSIEIFHIDASANGFALGAETGVVIPTGSIAIELAGNVLYQAYGAETANGDKYRDSGSGFRFLFRGGISIPFGEQR